jgi:hypothetical protein
MRCSYAWRAEPLFEGALKRGGTRSLSGAEYSEDGVNLSLIRWTLSLTPAERLAFLQRQINAILKIRRLNGR